MIVWSASNAGLLWLAFYIAQWFRSLDRLRSLFLAVFTRFSDTHMYFNTFTTPRSTQSLLAARLVATAGGNILTWDVFEVYTVRTQAAKCPIPASRVIRDRMVTTSLGRNDSKITINVWFVQHVCSCGLCYAEFGPLSSIRPLLCSRPTTPAKTRGPWRR